MRLTRVQIRAALRRLVARGEVEKLGIDEKTRSRIYRLTERGRGVAAPAHVCTDDCRGHDHATLGAGRGGARDG